MPITLAIVSGTFGDGTVRETIEFASREGFRAVELHGRRHSSRDLSAADIADIKAASQDGITFNLHFQHDATPASADPDERRETERHFLSDLEMVSDVGGDVMVLHPRHANAWGGADDPSERQRAAERMTTFVRSVADEANDRGVVIAIENLHFVAGDVVASYSELAGLIDSIDRPNVFVVLDIGHSLLKRDLPDAIDTLGKRVRHLHLNDAVDDVEHQEIGIGILDLDHLAALTTDAYQIRYATLEVGLGGSDAEGIVLRSRDVLRSRFPDAFV